MDHSPEAIAARLTQYVDDLLVAREQGEAAIIRAKTQMIVRALEKLRTLHAATALPGDLVSRIQRDKARAALDLPASSAGYDNICWDCKAHGKRVVVDRRVDPICKTCGWVQCPDCGACRDAKSGACRDRVYR